MIGVSLLQHFRPPDGFRTTGALVTTYSAELIACMALLVSMDGGGAEKVDCNKIAALRALERLRERVRFVANANRVKWGNSGDARIMALFDSTVHTVPFDCRTRSFHPKVIVARQECKGQPDRFALYVGSRNLTSSTAWDLGVGLVGRARASLPAGHRKLQTLHPFVRAVLHLVNDVPFEKCLGKLGEVAWELPEGVSSFDFAFHAGRSRTFDECALSKLPKRGEALLLSPFLSSGIVNEICVHFRDADSLRLVSGRTYLDKIAETSTRKHFESEGGNLKAYDMELAPDDASDDPPTEEEVEEELEAVGRGLHAKAFAIRSESRAHMIVGSANLTNAAWLNENWEAFVVLGGSRELATELFDWANAHGQIYRPPPPSTRTKEEADPINDVRSALGTVKVILDETKRIPVLTCTELPRFLAGSKVKLRVARLTTPLALTHWDAASIEMPTCAPSERTEFLLVEARLSDEMRQTWLQRAEATPSIGSERDRQAFIKILGVSDFFRYLQGLIEGGEPSDGDEGNGGGGGGGAANSEVVASTFRLENLLRSLAADRDVLEEVDQVVIQYQDLFRRMPLEPSERERLEQFTATWRAVAEGMKP